MERERAQRTGPLCVCVRVCIGIQMNVLKRFAPIGLVEQSSFSAQ